MKKLAVFLLAIVLILSVSGCGGTSIETTEPDSTPDPDPEPVETPEPDPDVVGLTQTVIVNLIGEDVAVLVNSDVDFSEWEISYSFKGNDVVATGTFDENMAMILEDANNDFAGAVVEMVQELITDDWEPIFAEDGLTQTVVVNLLGENVDVLVMANKELTKWEINYNFKGNDVVATGTFDENMAMILEDANNDFAGGTVELVQEALTDDWK